MEIEDNSEHNVFPQCCRNESGAGAEPPRCGGADAAAEVQGPHGARPLPPGKGLEAPIPEGEDLEVPPMWEDFDLQLLQ